MHHFHDDDVVDPHYHRANTLLEDLEEEEDFRGERPADKSPEKK